MEKFRIQKSKFKRWNRLLLKKIIFFYFLLLTFDLSLSAQQATWIWYPGDYEIWLSNQMQNRRTDRETFFPVFWKVDNHYALMDFHKVFDLKEPEDVSIYAEGQYNVKLDGKPFEGTPTK
jgi:alpha-L-rhamnosidase